jgi:hypothetical protein
MKKRRTRADARRVDIGAALAVRAFAQGFHAGADPRRALGRHPVDASTHEHWRHGFEAGRRAIIAAEDRYGQGLKQLSTSRRR